MTARSVGIAGLVFLTHSAGAAEPPQHLSCAALLESAKSVSEDVARDLLRELLGKRANPSIRVGRNISTREENVLGTPPKVYGTISMIFEVGNQNPTLDIGIYLGIRSQSKQSPDGPIAATRVWLERLQPRTDGSLPAEAWYLGNTVKTWEERAIQIVGAVHQAIHGSAFPYKPVFSQDETRAGSIHTREIVVGYKHPPSGLMIYRVQFGHLGRLTDIVYEPSYSEPLP